MSKRKVQPGAKDPAAAKLGQKGGKARLKTMTPEQRSASARHAVLSRYGKNKPVTPCDHRADAYLARILPRDDDPLLGFSVELICRECGKRLVGAVSEALTAEQLRDKYTWKDGDLVIQGEDK